MKTFLWIITVVVVAIALFAARSSFLAARDARAALAGITTQRTKLHSDVESATQRLAAAQHDEAELQTVLGQVRTQTAAALAAPKKTVANTPPPNQSEVAALLEANPALRELFKSSVRAGLGLRFRSFYAASNLTPQQIAKFEEIMVQDAEDKMTLGAIIQKQGVAANDPAIPQMRKQMGERLKDSLKEALGDVAYEQFQDLSRIDGATGFVQNVASLLVDKSTPLTEAQTQRLREVVANASPSYKTGGKVEPGNVDWPRVIAEAQAFLGPSQITALRAQSQLPQVFVLVQQYYKDHPAPSGK